MADKPKTYYMNTGKTRPQKSVYEDQLPDNMSLEDFRKTRGTVVWCKYYECVHNKQFENTQRTTGTIRKKTNFNPINKQEHIWKGLCTRDEIGVDFKTFFSSGAKFKVPACFVAGTNKTGYMDFSKLLQSDGTPYGGNIDSQSSEHGSTGYIH